MKNSGDQFESLIIQYDNIFSSAESIPLENQLIQQLGNPLVASISFSEETAPGGEVNISFLCNSIIKHGNLPHMEILEKNGGHITNLSIAFGHF